MHHRPGQIAAFTLVEILIVIAVIAILAALMFSVASQAKSKSLETVDISNMRQVYTALCLYEQDHNETNPVTLMYLKDYGGSEAIFRSPKDPIKDHIAGGFPARLFTRDRQRSPFRISYAFLGSIESWSTTPEVWQAARAQSTMGILACTWYGTVISTSLPHDDYLELGPLIDGPILRINMDGSFYRLAKRRYPRTWGSIDDLFLGR